MHQISLSKCSVTESLAPPKFFSIRRIHVHMHHVVIKLPLVMIRTFCI